MENELNGLAKERNLLANEHTLPAYIRTCLACWGMGLLVVKFFSGSMIFWLGLGFLLGGLVLGVIGFRRFLVYKRRL